jgi:hypothetical protein
MLKIIRMMIEGTVSISIGIRILRDIWNPRLRSFILWLYDLYWDIGSQQLFQKPAHP